MAHHTVKLTGQSYWWVRFSNKLGQFIRSIRSEFLKLNPRVKASAEFEHNASLFACICVLWHDKVAAAAIENEVIVWIKNTIVVQQHYRISGQNHTLYT